MKCDQPWSFCYCFLFCLFEDMFLELTFNTSKEMLTNANSRHWTNEEVQAFVSFVKAEAIQSMHWSTEEIYAPKHRKVQS